MADETLLKTLNQVWRYLVDDCGYRCSYKRVKAASERNELVARRGGGWTRHRVDQFARAFLDKKVDADPELDAPITPGGDGNTGAATRKLERQADVMEIQAMRARLDFNERLGRLTKTATMEAEIGERARAFRLGLERFGLEQAEHVAELFGGSRRQAEELAKRLGIQEGDAREKAIAVIIDFCMQRAGSFPRLFAGFVDGFLDPYATGRWWTEDMRQAWDMYERHANDPEIPEVPDAL